MGAQLTKDRQVMRVRRRNGVLCRVRSCSVASGTATPARAKNEIPTPLIGEQSGETPTGEHAEGGEWCLVVMLRTASVWL
jgi:hypothetical protein